MYKDRSMLTRHGLDLLSSNLITPYWDILLSFADHGCLNVWDKIQHESSSSLVLNSICGLIYTYVEFKKSFAFEYEIE